MQRASDLPIMLPSCSTRVAPACDRIVAAVGPEAVATIGTFGDTRRTRNDTFVLTTSSFVAATSPAVSARARR